MPDTNQGKKKMKQLRNLLKKGMFSIKNTVKWFWIIAFVTGLGLSSTLCSEGGGGLGKVKWEYKVYYHDNYGLYDEKVREAFNAKINELGEEGWELVSSGSSGRSNYTTSDVFILKRKL